MLEYLTLFMLFDTHFIFIIFSKLASFHSIAILTIPTARYTPIHPLHSINNLQKVDILLQALNLLTKIPKIIVVINICRVLQISINNLIIKSFIFNVFPKNHIYYYGQRFYNFLVILNFQLFIKLSNIDYQNLSIKLSSSSLALMHSP
ncbi:hypothetical protein IMAU30028_02136 [Lactobacillus helveticus]|nr:hypothetical protein [Lactobacillus helveticus]